jgi:hypothetical protein
MTEEQACKEAYEHIAKYIEEAQDWIKEVLNELKNATNCWDFLKVKKQLMYTIIDMLPIYIEDCPFCYIYKKDKEDCEECPYGKMHGICRSVFSPYSRRMREIDNLMNAITNYGQIPDEE